MDAPKKKTLKTTTYSLPSASFDMGDSVELHKKMVSEVGTSSGVPGPPVGMVFYKREVALMDFIERVLPTLEEQVAAIREAVALRAQELGDENVLGVVHSSPGIAMSDDTNLTGDGTLLRYEQRGSDTVGMFGFLRDEGTKKVMVWENEPMPAGYRAYFGDVPPPAPPEKILA